MTAAGARRARLLRLRTIEHRVATARLVEADTAHAAVIGISERITMLRNSTIAAEGSYSGRDLQNAAELADRLDHARIGLDKALADSLHLRMVRDADRIVAHVRQERTHRVHSAALTREDAERELRAASAQPPRLKKRND